MELKQLRSFATVVESRSFTKAAEKLYTSQPTISTHIRQLEEQLHSRLIVRTTKSIEVTPRGWELYECAATILKLQDDGKAPSTIKTDLAAIRFFHDLMDAKYKLPDNEELKVALQRRTFGGVDRTWSREEFSRMKVIKNQKQSS